MFKRFNTRKIIAVRIRCRSKAKYIGLCMHNSAVDDDIKFPGYEGAVLGVSTLIPGQSCEEGSGYFLSYSINGFFQSAQIGEPWQKILFS